MTQITAGQVKELREMTGAGMMDCKKALTETAGDFEEAVDWLRKKGLAAAAKKALSTGRAVPWSKSTPRPISSPATSNSRPSCAAPPN
jgi:hypothetical protein